MKGSKQGPPSNSKVAAPPCSQSLGALALLRALAGAPRHQGKAGVSWERSVRGLGLWGVQQQQVW